VSGLHEKRKLVSEILARQSEFGQNSCAAVFWLTAKLASWLQCAKESIVER
jgi:hypothetical protein